MFPCDSRFFQERYLTLSHLSWSSIWWLSDQFDLSQQRKLSMCKGCLLGKSTQCKFPASTHHRTWPFDLIHMELAGPMNTYEYPLDPRSFLPLHNYRWLHVVQMDLLPSDKGPSLYSLQRFPCADHNTLWRNPSSSMLGLQERVPINGFLQILS